VPITQAGLTHNCKSALVVSLLLFLPLISELINDLLFNASDNEDAISIGELDFDLGLFDFEEADFGEQCDEGVIIDVFKEFIVPEYFSPNHHFG
jgi:hypothetical protein